LVDLDCFITLLFALLSLWWSSILLNLFFVSWFVLLKFDLLFWFDFKNGSFVLLCLIYGLRFLIIVEFDLLGLFCLLVCVFPAFDFGVFCSMVCVVEVCLVVFIWLWKWGLLFCCVWFMVCVFLLLWKFDLLGLFCLLVCDFLLRGRFCLILCVHCVESC